MRFAITTAAGFLPGGGFIGTGLGALDTFLVDSVIAEPGLYSFLSDTWPPLALERSACRPAWLT